MSELVRSWVPVGIAVAALPLWFLGLRACAPSIGQATSAGSPGCAGCHGAEAEAWSGSQHAQAERPIAPGDPVPALPEGSPAPVRRIGVTPVVQWLVPARGGRLQVTQTAWDPEAQEWFDVFADGREAGEWGHWTGGGMTWNSQCAACHNTGVDKGWDGAGYETVVAEVGVGCAACHGDTAAHQSGGPPPVVPAERWMDVCASCHARRAELTGAFRPGDAFLDHFAPSLVDRTDTFWADGQVREEDFEYTAYLGSRMHQAGVRCVDCHDPHSGRLVRDGDALCVSCHAAVAPHDPHLAATVGCVGCHMPVTVYMQRDARHDHGLFVPDPRVSALGLPDVCTRCHDDRDGPWAVAAARAWWGEPRTDRPARAAAVLAARSGAIEDAGPLLSLLRSERPARRATAAASLEAGLGEAPVRAALAAALSDPDPHVRFAAAGSLTPAVALPEVAAALTPLLEDPVRAVRVQAGRALRRVAPDSDAVGEYRTYLRRNGDQPPVLAEEGAWALEAGDASRAVALLGQAVTIDPGAGALREGLAVALAAVGDALGAVTQMRTAAALPGADAETWFRLGLAEAAVGGTAAAEVALERAVELDPDHARARSNLRRLRER